MQERRKLDADQQLRQKCERRRCAYLDLGNGLDLLEVVSLAVAKVAYGVVGAYIEQREPDA